MSIRRGNLLVLSAPSGSGKTTLLGKLLASLDAVEFSVSFTTRSRRAEERDGVDYHFVSEDVFQSKITADELLEWAKVHGSLYGTGRAETEAMRERGNDVLLDVDVQGADQVRQACPDAVTIFVLPPSFADLEQRLTDRSSDQPEDIETRLKAARREVGRYTAYDYVIINDDIDRAADLLRAIVLAERAPRRRMEPQIRPIVRSFE